MKTKAFTLIELLVTVVIVALITAVAVSTYQGYVIKSRWSAVQPCITDTAIRLENYRSNHGLYPADDPYDAINSSGACGDYYAGEITVFNDGVNFIVIYQDTEENIGPSDWEHDAWAITDASDTIYHINNPLDPDDVDSLPSPYDTYLPTF